MIPSVPLLHRRSGDLILFSAVLGLLVAGMVMVYSASSVVAYERLADSAYYLKRQAVWVGIGLMAMLVARSVYYQKLRAFAVPVLLLSILLLFAVLLPQVGHVAGGARRWISVGLFSFQPVEVAKPALLLFLAHFCVMRSAVLGDLKSGVVPPLVVTGVMATLVFLQPDMGSAVLLGAIALAVLFMAGVRIAHLGLLLAAGIPVVVLGAVRAEYRIARLLAFLDPWNDPQGSGFHIIQSLLALGSGGLFGVGLGESRQKFFYLPERHTDFIFAILGEELGLAGTLGLLCLFALLAYRGYRISRAAPDRFGALLAAGITVSIVGQALANMGVVTGLLPVKGVTLPLVSFGGSSLVTTMAQLGVLMNVSRYSRESSAPAGRPEATRWDGAREEA